MGKIATFIEFVPLTSSTERLYPSEATVAFEGKKCKAMADLLATVSKERLFRRAGVLSVADMHKVMLQSESNWIFIRCHWWPKKCPHQACDKSM
jgi:mRNA-degrading endonuclease toxin of MazEF toxin-antitoxin module